MWEPDARLPLSDIDTGCCIWRLVCRSWASNFGCKFCQVFDTRRGVKRWCQTWHRVNLELNKSIWRHVWSQEAGKLYTCNQFDLSNLCKRGLILSSQNKLYSRKFKAVLLFELLVLCDHIGLMFPQKFETITIFSCHTGVKSIFPGFKYDKSDASIEPHLTFHL